MINAAATKINDNAFRRDEELQARVVRLMAAFNSAINQMNFTRNCLNCSYFTEASETCEKFGNQRPPAAIIAYGCVEHSIEIPF